MGAHLHAIIRMTGTSTRPPRKRKAPADPLVIGWREYVGLPDLGVPAVNAKIDTGARTSALHATHIRLYEQDGHYWVEFQPPRIGRVWPPRCRLPVHDERAIRNSSGLSEPRIVIRTRLSIARRRWSIDLSLADRAEMSHPLIIGRSAIRRRKLLVDCGHSYILGKYQNPDDPDRN